MAQRNVHGERKDGFYLRASEKFVEQRSLTRTLKSKSELAWRDSDDRNHW